MKRKIISYALGLTFLASPCFAQTTSTVNFGSFVEYPLVKKIGVYQTPIIDKAKIDRDMRKLSDIEARAMRYELAWGKDLYAYPTIKGTKDNPIYDFKELDYLFDMAAPYTSSFVFAHGYTPDILKPNNDGNAWMLMPTDLNVWGKINKRYAQHWKEKGFTNSYVEMWNEPDLYEGFFLGSMEDYLQLYEYAAPAIREGNPDVKVGGPAGAFTWWHDAMVTQAINKNLPLDFLSGHYYGTGFEDQLNVMRNSLIKLGRPEAEMLMTEFAPYPPDQYQKDEPVEWAEAAMTFFNSLPTMLSYPDLSYVTWAQWIDPIWFVDDKLGLIDHVDGCRKALYNGFRLYGMMPVDRCKIELSDPALQGMASCDSAHVAAVVWNKSNDERPLKLQLRSLPFQKGRLEVYHVDIYNNSWYESGNDDLIPTRTEDIDLTGTTTTLEDVVRGKGVFFVRITAENAAPLFPKNNFAKLIHTHMWFPQRSAQAPYGLFDAKTWTANLSTNTNTNGRALVAVTAEEMPDQFRVTTQTRGGVVSKRNAESAFCLRMDYADTNGSYVKSVVYHGGVFTEKRTSEQPWGTLRSADEVVKVDNIKDFTVDLKAHAPNNFGGRVVLTFELGNVGASKKASFQLHRMDEVSLASLCTDSVGVNEVLLSAGLAGRTDLVKAGGFLYAIGSDPANGGETLVGEVKGNSVKGKLTGLQANKIYRVRTFVVKTNGDTLMSDEADVRTQPRKANVTTRTPTVNQSTLTATLKGRLVSDYGSDARYRGFVWCKGVDHEPTIDKDNVVYVDTDKAAFSYDFTGLSNNTDYSFRAFVITRAGICYGDVIAFPVGTTGVEDIETVPSQIEGVYTMGGCKIPSIVPGINIIKYKNGSVQKIFHKVPLQ